MVAGDFAVEVLDSASGQRVSCLCLHTSFLPVGETVASFSKSTVDDAQKSRKFDSKFTVELLLAPVLHGALELEPPEPEPESPPGKFPLFELEVGAMANSTRHLVIRVQSRSNPPALVPQPASTWYTFVSSRTLLYRCACICSKSLTR